MGIEFYRGMTQDEFLGKPKIIADRKNMPLVNIAKLASVDSVPFLDRYTAKFGDGLIMVFHDETLIASHIHYGGDDQIQMVVHDSYRGLGIGTEMLYQKYMRYPKKGTESIVRTKGLHATLVRVWERIAQELAATE